MTCWEGADYSHNKKSEKNMQQKKAKLVRHTSKHFATKTEQLEETLKKRVKPENPRLEGTEGPNSRRPKAYRKPTRREHTYKIAHTQRHRSNKSNTFLLNKKEQLPAPPLKLEIKQLATERGLGVGKLTNSP